MLRLILCLFLFYLPSCIPSVEPLDRDHDGVARIVVLGDSNSALFTPDVWVWQMRDALVNDTLNGAAVWDVQTFAVPGARITPYPSEPQYETQRQIDRVWRDAPYFDVAILAFGTNDHLGGQSPIAIAQAYLAARDQLDPTARLVLAASTPPCTLIPYCDITVINAINTQLTSVWPLPLIDFTSWVTANYLDPTFGIHFTTEGHTLRAFYALAYLSGIS